MASEIEFVNYKDFVKNLQSVDYFGEKDESVACNDADGPRKIPGSAFPNRKEINSHYVKTNSRAASSSSDYSYYFQSGLRYKLTNTSASGAIQASTRNSDLSTVDSITNLLSHGSSIVFTASNDAVFLHVYYTASNGSCTIECLDGIYEKVAENANEINAIKNSGVMEKVLGNDRYLAVKTTAHSSNVTISDGTALISIENKDTYFGITLKSVLVTSSKYTLSFDVKDFDGESIAMEFYFNGQSKVKIVGNGHYACRFTATDTAVVFDDVSRAGATIGDSFKITNIHVYEGNDDYSVDSVVVAPVPVSSEDVKILAVDGNGKKWLPLQEVWGGEWVTCEGNGLTGVTYKLPVLPNTFYTLVFKNPSWSITGISSAQNKWSLGFFDKAGTSLNMAIEHFGDFSVSSNNVFFTPSEASEVAVFIRADVGQSVEFAIREGYPGCVSVAEIIESFAGIRYDNIFVAGVFTDTHGFENMFSVIPEILDTELEIAKGPNSNKLCDCMLELGDVVREYPTENDAFVPYGKLFNKKYGVPILPICGNHDFGASFALDWWQEQAKIIDTVFSPAISKGYIPNTTTGDYVVDFSAQKVRIIGLNGYLHGGVFYENGKWEKVTYDSSKPLIARNTSYTAGDIVNLAGWTDYSYRAKVNLTTPTQTVLNNSRSDDFPCWESIPNTSYLTDEQKQWYLDSLLSTPQNYAVVVAMHTVFTQNGVWDKSRKFSDKNFNQDNFPSSVMNGDLTDFIANATNAFVNGESFSQDGAAANFANKNSGVEFMCFVGGHHHRDGIVYHSTFENLKQVLVTTTAGNKYTNVPDITVYENNPTITLLRIDKAKKRIMLAKLGSRVSKDGYIRDYECVDL